MDISQNSKECVIDKNEEFDDEEVDPRIENELENLNKASAQINEWENQMDELRNNYRLILSQSSGQLAAFHKKLGSCVDKAKPYYEAKKKLFEAQKESQAAARRYDRACDMLEKGKELVETTEAQAKVTGGGRLDPAILEMLNHAIAKVNNAKTERSESHTEHEKCTATYLHFEKIARDLEKEHKSDIKKARPYFEMTSKFNERMQEEKMRVDVYKDKVSICKTIYSEALHNLEEISREVHQRREEARLCREMGPRGEGVGAEMPPQAEVETRMNSVRRQASTGDKNATSPSTPPPRGAAEVVAAVDAARHEINRLSITSPMQESRSRAESAPSGYCGSMEEEEGEGKGESSRRRRQKHRASSRSVRRFQMDTMPIFGLIQEQLQVQNRADESARRNRTGTVGESWTPDSIPSSDTESLHTLDDDVLVDFDARQWELEPPTSTGQH